MRSSAVIEAGICGFETTVTATCVDECTVTFEVQTPCEKVANFASVLRQSGQIDAHQEISPANKSIVMETARHVMKGCCAACVVPAGLFKCMQVATGLAIPKTIRIRLSEDY